MSTPLADLCHLKWELDRLEYSLGNLTDRLADMELQNWPEVIELNTSLATFARDFTLVVETLTNRNLGTEFVELHRRKSSLGAGA